jgi:hypothetical protein
MALTKLNYTGQGTIPDSSLPTIPISKIPTITGAKMPSNSILQVKETTWINKVTVSNATWTTTGHSVSITPFATSSKIYLSVHGGGAYNENIINMQGDWTIYRSINGGTATNIADAANSPLWSMYENTFFGHPHSFSTTNSPNTALPITYTVYMKTQANATRHYTYNLNSRYHGGDAAKGAPVHFTAMEIKG